VSSGRSGTIAVGNQTYAVTQAGNPLITRLGLFRGGAWYLDYKGTGSWSGCGAPADATKDMCEAFGLSSDLSVVGDWNGDGKTKIGVFRAGNWYLDYNGTGSWSGCGAPAVPGSDACLTFGGVSSDLPVVGDWNGDGKTKIGVFRAGNWYLDYNGTGSWSGCGAPAVPGSDACLTFGMASDLPVAGDWNGDGKTKIGTFRAGNWYLDYNGNGLWDGCGAPGQAGKDACFAFGLATDIPVTGDWSGDGKTKIGLFRNGSWYLDRNGNGLWDGCDNQDLAKDACFTYGITSDTPLTGLW
jgi:hypothetical protein